MSDRLPTALVVVAWLFILSGAAALLGILVGLTNGRMSFNTSVVGLFVGPGLLRLRPGWRTCALVLIWIGLILSPVLAIVMLNAPGSVAINFFGLSVGKGPVLLAWVLLAAMITLLVWQYRVLTRPDVRQLFGLKDG